MTDMEALKQFKDLIQNHCGMMITEVHSTQLEKYVKAESGKRGISLEELFQCCIADYKDMIGLINAVVVNETYFFREEKQFNFLREYITANFYGKEIVIWSAACSSGEEPYSLASLALACGAKPVVYATDIDTDALMQLKNGVYGFNSFRNDGNSFKKYLDPYLSEATDEAGKKVYAVAPELKSYIICGRANLLSMETFPAVPKTETVDIIFIRNVFIYFDKDTRDVILKNLSFRLKKGGLLFFSMSEIAGINPTDSTIPLVKKTKNSVFYFERESKPSVLSADNSTLTPEPSTKPRTVASSVNATAPRDSILDKLNERISEGARTGLFSSNGHNTPDIPKAVSTGIDTPEALWSEIQKLVGKKQFSEAERLAENCSLPVNSLYMKYYCLGFINAIRTDRKDEVKAVSCYEKAGISNPHFWPAFYQLAELLQGKEDANSRRKRYDALVKTATILENEKEESEKYNYLNGAFSAGYFYRICNEYLKKEFSR